MAMFEGSVWKKDKAGCVYIPHSEGGSINRNMLAFH